MIPEVVINEIADDLESGFKCYVHKRTYDVVSFPEDNMLNDNVEDWEEDMEKIELDRESYIEVEPLGSFESFKIMEDFVKSLPGDNPSKSKLTAVLEEPKPVSNFKKIIHHSGETRDLWFSFRRAKNIEWVREQLNQVLTS